MAGIARVGIGYDVHRLVEDRPLVLGGIQIDWPKGLAGHSDGDALLHALIDAVLGAAGLPDIGEVFPDTDPAYKDIDSAELVKKTMLMADDGGWVVVNADVTIRAASPKLGPHKQAMRQRSAELLRVGPEAMSVKAKSEEGLGPIGRGEAIGCLAVVGLARR